MLRVTDRPEAVTTSGPLAALAHQLREGPLQEMTELYRRAMFLSRQGALTDQERLQQLTELALVSLAAMEHFHAFTRELRAQINELTATPAHELH